MAAEIQRLAELAEETSGLFHRIETVTIVIMDRVSGLQSRLSSTDASELGFITRLVDVADGLALSGEDMANQLAIGIMGIGEGN